MAMHHITDMCTNNNRNEKNENNGYFLLLLLLFIISGDFLRAIGKIFKKQKDIKFRKMHEIFI